MATQRVDKNELIQQLDGALVNSDGKDFTIRADFVREIIDALSLSSATRAIPEEKPVAWLYENPLTPNLAASPIADVIRQRNATVSAAAAGEFAKEGYVVTPLYRVQPAASSTERNTDQRSEADERASGDSVNGTGSYAGHRMTKPSSDLPNTGSARIAMALEAWSAAMRETRCANPNAGADAILKPGPYFEPTEEQIEAGREAQRRFMQRLEDEAKARGGSGSTFVYDPRLMIAEIWKAMLIAYPTLPPQEVAAINSGKQHARKPFAEWLREKVEFHKDGFTEQDQIDAAAALAALPVKKDHRWSDFPRAREAAFSCDCPIIADSKGVRPVNCRGPLTPGCQDATRSHGTDK